jgi:hypothetical protein
MSDPKQTPHPPEVNRNSVNDNQWRANKYPTIKQRGFYSDIASEENLSKIGVNTCFYIITQHLSKSNVF